MVFGKRGGGITLHSKKRWQLSSSTTESIESLSEQLQIEPLTARLISAAEVGEPILAQQILSDDQSMRVDAVCKLPELTIKFMQEYQRHASNSGELMPRLLIMGVEITDFRAIGDQHQHLKLTVRQEELSVECIGYDMGDLFKEITPYAKANLVAEPVIREWNGISKLQLQLLDLEIPEMQIFDYREAKDKFSKLLPIVGKESVILCFRKESIVELKLLDPTLEAGIFYVEEELSYSMIKNSEEMYLNVVLYDTPYCMDQFHYGLSIVPKPERIYCLFGAEYKDRLAVIPSRDQFKWLYAVFVKLRHVSFNAIPQLVKSRNISEPSVQFMLQVFLELGFIVEKEGNYNIQPSPIHRHLRESKHYRRKQTEMELETEILYSSYGILCKTIKQVTL